MRSILLIVLGLTVVTAVPKNRQRIVGGSPTTIDQYPFGAAILFTWKGSPFSQGCGGTILNSRSILTAAHCVDGDLESNVRIRLGSTFANSGGTVYNTNRFIMHVNYNPDNYDNDIAILQSTSIFEMSNSVRVGSIAGSNYNLGDNQVVWAIGWGRIFSWGPSSERLRHVQIWSVNQNECAKRYGAAGFTITENMLCSGWLDVGGRDQCVGDSGGPLVHNNVVVGVCSWGNGCAEPSYPGVNVRVSRFTSWIQANA